MSPDKRRGVYILAAAAAALVWRYGEIGDGILSLVATPRLGDRERQTPAAQAVLVRRISSPFKHSLDLLHLLMDYLCWRLLANERVGATEPIPQVVDFMGLLPDERAAAVGVLSPFSRRSKSGLLFGR
jgi:hypothetical protein